MAIKTNIDNDPDFDDDAGGGEGEGKPSDTGGDDDEDDEPEPSRPAADGDADEEEQRKTRREKRAARASRHAELERANAEARERDQRYQLELEQLRQQNLLFQQQLVSIQRPQQPTPEDPYKSKLENVQLRQQQLAREYEALPAGEKVARTREYEEKYQQLDVEKHEIIADRRFEQRHAGQIQGYVQNQTQQQNPQRAAAAAVLKMEFQDLIPERLPDGTPNGGLAKDQNLLRHWDAMVKLEMARGRQETIDLWRECAEKTRVAFKLPTAKRTPPTASEKERFTGRAAQGDATGERRSNAPLTKEEKRLARKAYPYLAEEKAYSRWRKETADQAND